MTPEKKALMLVAAVAELIQEAGQVPSGHLYMALMTHLPNITLEMYNNILILLENEKLITNKAHLLTWVGPKPAEVKK